MQKLQYREHPSKIYETIRKINGKLPRKTHILTEGNQVYATVPEIAEKFATSSQQVSSNENYAQEFLHRKTAIEQENINFSSRNTEPYNKPFTVEELEYNLSRTKNTALGFDGIHYQMLKKMALKAKEYTCRIFNKLWHTSYFPRQWNTAIVVHIYKLEKYHSNSTNYRPISLTSSSSKLLERLINKTLMDYLEIKLSVLNSVDADEAEVS